MGWQDLHTQSNFWTHPDGSLCLGICVNARPSTRQHAHGNIRRGRAKGRCLARLGGWVHLLFKVHGPAAWALPASLLEMQNPSLCHRPSESESAC